MVGTIGPLPHIPTIFSQIPPSSPITNPGHTGPACGMKGKLLAGILGMVCLGIPNSPIPQCPTFPYLALTPRP